MAKRSMRNTKRKEAKLLETRTALVEAALNEGHTTKRGICKATGLKLHELGNLFTANRSLYGLYVVRRKTMVDIAADNLQDIINDKNHPQHFAASKYVLQNYRSDLDDILEPMAGDMSVEIPSLGDSEREQAPVVIKFTGGKKE